MKNVRTMIMSAVLVAAAAMSAQAQAGNQATQDLTINITAINKISVAGGSHTMTINTATAGQAPDDVTWTTNWAVTTNQSNAKITASIGTSLPSGVTLKVDLTAPSNASSVAGADLSDGGSVDVVTGITKLNEASLPLTYTVSATALAGVQSVSKTVTYTVTGGV
jgi:hypothetical protein